jgi:hypothetical protein
MRHAVTDAFAAGIDLTSLFGLLSNPMVLKVFAPRPRASSSSVT